MKKVLRLMSFFTLKSNQLLIVGLLIFIWGCDKKTSNSNLSNTSSSLAREIIYHGSVVSSFSESHLVLPTTDPKFPGGPAWFSPGDRELSMWRAGQVAADMASETGPKNVYLHQYRLQPGLNILDLGELTTGEFYDDLVDDRFYNVFNQRGVVKEFFANNPSYDGFIGIDEVSGKRELILRDPAKSLRLSGGPLIYVMDMDLSCVSCVPLRYVFEGALDSFALIPDSACGPGYRIAPL